ncbi:Uncharacterised protein [Candidatus Norongarragalina meridionalis]|nr:Uncharacterised protein [Candidatus Norongarragalina meridionalis]
MDIGHYDKNVLTKLYNFFVENNLIYGMGTEYNSLLTPSSTLLEVAEVNEISNDLKELWKLYSTWNTLYLKSVAGEAPPWIREYSEYGMAPEEIEASRLCSAGGLEPRLCRVDYVCLGSKRSIAEIQWKTGGPGLFFGISDAYSKAIPSDAKNEYLGMPTESFYNVIVQAGNNNQTVAVNLVRDVWLNGEAYLERAYRDRGLTYIPIERRESHRRIIERNNVYFAIDDKNKSHEIDFINGQGFTQFLPKKRLIGLAQATLEGKIWIETPLNYIYRQKWGLSLPFVKEYRALFSDRLRDIIIPTALLSDSHLDLSLISANLEHPLRDELLDVQSIARLADLPTSLRKALVLKCGAGTGEFYSDGKGVFRLSGSRSSALRILEFIEGRIKIRGEPWIIQPFIDSTHSIPVSLPWALNNTKPIEAHARIMIFGGRLGTKDPEIIGGLGNYGRHWKVSGRSPGVDEQGNICGTAFNDIRVKLDN